MLCQIHPQSASDTKATCFVKFFHFYIQRTVWWIIPSDNEWMGLCQRVSCNNSAVVNHHSPISRICNTITCTTAHIMTLSDLQHQLQWNGMLIHHTHWLQQLVRLHQTPSPSLWGDEDPHLIKCFLGTLESPPQTGHRSVQPFLHSLPKVTDWQMAGIIDQ